MQNQEFPRLIISTLIESVWDFATSFGAKNNPFCLKDEFQLQLRNLKNYQKTLFLVKNGIFLPKNQFSLFGLKRYFSTSRVRI